MLVRAYADERGVDIEKVKAALEKLGESTHPNSAIANVEALDAELGIGAPVEEEPGPTSDDEDLDVPLEDPNLKKERDKTPEAQVKPTTRVLGRQEPGKKKYRIEVAGKKSELPVGVYHAWGHDETQAISEVPKAYRIKDTSKTRFKATLAK